MAPIVMQNHVAEIWNCMFHLLLCYVVLKGLKVWNMVKQLKFSLLADIDSNLDIN